MYSKHIPYTNSLTFSKPFFLLLKLFEYVSQFDPFGKFRIDALASLVINGMNITITYSTQKCC